MPQWINMPKRPWVNHSVSAVAHRVISCAISSPFLSLFLPSPLLDGEAVRPIGWRELRERYPQPLGRLLERYTPVPEQADPYDPRRLARGQRSDDGPSVFGRAHLVSVERLLPARKAEVLSRPRDRGLLEGSPFRVGRSFAGDLPGAAAEDAFSVGSHPRLHAVQQMEAFVVQGAVGSLGDVQQQVAVLADDVHQHLENVPRGLVDVAHVVEPVTDAGVGLPGVFEDLVALTPLDVEHAYGVNVGVRVLLGVDCPVFAVRCCARVI